MIVGEIVAAIRPRLTSVKVKVVEIGQRRMSVKKKSPTPPPKEGPFASPMTVRFRE